MNKPSNYLESEKVLNLLKEIESNSYLTQRYLSKRLSLSLGKINFLIRALVNKGIIEIKNFKQSKNKLGYVYLLTPEGLNIKFHLTQEFLTWKIQEYNNLKEEIEILKKEFAFMQDQEKNSGKEIESKSYEQLEEG